MDVRGKNDVQGLAQLESTIRQDLEILKYPAHSWIKPRVTKSGNKILDVLIIGGGQGGLGVAFGLMQEKVHHLLVIDENPEGMEGPWRTFARMPTLRTPKHVSGPDFGIPSLSFQAWYEAQFGHSSWHYLRFIPTHQWSDYLHWYRKTLKIPVQNDIQAGAIQWNKEEHCFEIPTRNTNSSQNFTQTLFARKVVLATGIDGSGKWEVPKEVRSLPKSLYSHTRENIDFNHLKGKRVGILGAGASAFDNAAVALENGAVEVHQFFRRHELPNINPYRWAEFVGFLKHHADLPDAEKWKFISQILKMGQLPPKDTYFRCKQFKNFYLHPGSTDLKLVPTEKNQILATTTQSFQIDYLIVGSGFITDLSLRPELASMVNEIQLWKERYTPPRGTGNTDLSNHPYLGPNFEFLPKHPETADFIRSIFNYTFGGLLSLGLGGSSISGLKYSLPRIVSGITKQLYLDDSALHLKALENYNEVEFET